MKSPNHSSLKMYSFQCSNTEIFHSKSHLRIECLDWVGMKKRGKGGRYVDGCDIFLVALCTTNRRICHEFVRTVAIV